MKPLLRLWHFLAGHPATDVWVVVEDATLECERCGKCGERL